MRTGLKKRGGGTGLGKRGVRTGLGKRGVRTAGKEGWGDRTGGRGV